MRNKQDGSPSGAYSSSLCRRAPTHRPVLAFGIADRPALQSAPAQRLCKYPLLLDELLRGLPAKGGRDVDSSRVALEAALGAVRSIAKEVNEKVRQAEGRARLLACAHALSHPELIAPQRILLHEADVEAQKLSTRGTLGQRQRCRVWLASDAVLVGREHALLAAARVGIPLGKGGTSKGKRKKS